MTGATRRWLRRCGVAILVPLAAGLLLVLVSLAFVLRQSTAASQVARPWRAELLEKSVGDLPELRFAVLGDPERNRSVFRNCLAAARDRGCRFVVVTGDLIKDCNELAYELFLSDLVEMGFGDRFAVVIGNHDDQGLYARLFGSSTWSVQLGPALLIGVDNGDRKASTDQLTFVRNALRERGPDVVACLFAHKPIFPYHDEYHDGAETGDPPLQEALIQGGAELVLPSHFHGYIDRTFSGVREVISGGGGGNLHDDDVGYHFLQVDVAPNRVDVTRVDVPPTEPGLLAHPRRILERTGLYAWTKLARSRAAPD
jgi:hypothetical protein